MQNRQQSRPKAEVVNPSKFAVTATSRRRMRRFGNQFNSGLYLWLPSGGGGYQYTFRRCYCLVISMSFRRCYCLIIGTFQVVLLFCYWYALGSVIDWLLVRFYVVLLFGYWYAFRQCYCLVIFILQKDTTNPGYNKQQSPILGLPVESHKNTYFADDN